MTVTFPNFYHKKCLIILPVKLRDLWRPLSSAPLELGIAAQVSTSWLCLHQGMKQGRAPGWPQTALPALCWLEPVNTPQQCLAMGWGQSLLQAGCSVVPTLFWGGRGIEEGNQLSRSAAWPQAGEQLPAGSADWQGCSHQRPPTTYLKLSLFCKASSLLGSCVWPGYEDLFPYPAELLCIPDPGSSTSNSWNGLD